MIFGRKGRFGLSACSTTSSISIVHGGCASPAALCSRGSHSPLLHVVAWNSTSSALCIAIGIGRGGSRCSSSSCCIARITHGSRSSSGRPPRQLLGSIKQMIQPHRRSIPLHRHQLGIIRPLGTPKLLLQQKGLGIHHIVELIRRLRRLLFGLVGGLFVRVEFEHELFVGFGDFVGGGGADESEEFVWILEGFAVGREEGCCHG